MKTKKLYLCAVVVLLLVAFGCGYAYDAVVSNVSEPSPTPPNEWHQEIVVIEFTTHFWVLCENGEIEKTNLADHTSLLTNYDVPQTCKISTEKYGASFDLSCETSADGLWHVIAGEGTRGIANE
jgi:hypothetical protein